MHLIRMPSSRLGGLGLWNAGPYMAAMQTQGQTAAPSGGSGTDVLGLVKAVSGAAGDTLKDKNKIEGEQVVAQQSLLAAQLSQKQQRLALKAQEGMSKTTIATLIVGGVVVLGGIALLMRARSRRRS